MTRGVANRRLAYLREKHLQRDPKLISTGDALELTSMKRDTFLRMMRAANVEPVKRGQHGRLWWSIADVRRVVDTMRQAVRN